MQVKSKVNSNITTPEVAYNESGKPLDVNKLRELLKQMEEAERFERFAKSYETKRPAETSAETNKQTEKTEEKKPLKINLACGQIRQEGFIGIDKIKTDAVDIVHDLETYPWPFEDNSVDEVICSHYVEHTSNLIEFMDELWRIMKPPYKNEKGEEIKSKVTIIAPYYSSVRAWQDPTHKRAISEFTFIYFNKGWRDANKLDHYGIKSDFDFTYGYQMDPNWGNRAEDARVFAMKHYINVITDIHVTLNKR